MAGLYIILLVTVAVGSLLDGYIKEAKRSELTDDK